MQQLIASVINQVESVVIGKTKQVKLSLACLLGKGHLLIEDLPGMGKTTLAHTLSVSLGLTYQRVQFTSDLLPTDVIGVSIFNQADQSFTLHKGPIFNQVVLADEINRASPKTQSALLEAMEEKNVSIDGETHKLDEPFFVIATQNPLFHAGTYPLPESQLDRFMMQISLGFPDVEAEKKILSSGSESHHFSKIKPVITSLQLQEMQNEIANVHVSDAILDYVIALFQVSRSGDRAANPLSPRAGKSLIAAAKAWAFIDSRNHVLPDDILSVFSSVCEHRLLGGRTNPSQTQTLSEQILEEIDSSDPFNRIS